MSTKPHKTGNGALMRRFLPYLIKYKGVLFFDLFCAALTTLCDIALPTIMRTLTNTVSAAALTVDTVLRMAALYFVLRIIDGAASYFMSGIGHIIAETAWATQEEILSIWTIPIIIIPKSARSWAASPTTCLT